ncbi:HAMP domain-containing sensor histidine kinase [Microbacterium sp. GCM10011525]|uniref:sensor histidine kinase n=1 Tax=unclassified Microbacterium TaxID=2609290 RepID=UPI0012FA5891|nr:HAMP domain-containing protein [Microbacterium sp. MAH-37]
MVAVVLLIAAAIAVYAQITVIVEAREKAVLHGITEVYRGVIQEDPQEHFEKPGIKQHVAVIDPSGTTRMNTLPKGLQDGLDEMLAKGRGLHRISSTKETYYVYVDPVKTSEGTWYVIATRDTDIGEDVTGGVEKLLLTILAVGAVVFALGSWFVSGAALRPVEQLRRSAESLVVRRRDDLLPVGEAKDELNALAQTLNDLLERMRSASERERQMVSDASHELRNPLSVLQSQLALVDGADPAADAAVLEDARDTLTRLVRVADSLLQLSRIEAADAGGAATVLELASELTERVDSIRLRTAADTDEREIDIDFRIETSDPAAVVDIAASDFGRVIDNLVDNAIGAASASDVRVLVALTQTMDALTLTVEDDAGGLDPAIADRAFERFVRGSSSSYSGGGLGLAIVARLATLADGAVSLDDRPGVGATATVVLPTASGADVSANTHQR